MIDPINVEGYRDFSLVGSGGFSSVYRAFQERFHRPVAVKVLSNSIVDDQMRRRFLRECQIAGRLSTHPNITTVLDAGFAESGQPFIVFEFMSHGSLAAQLSQKGPLPVADVLSTGIKLAGALATVHAAGVLHRDVKPLNVLISEFGEPCLTDFGISAVASGFGETTATNSLTTLFTAPEVIEGDRCTPAADVYSLAATMYATIMGRSPFQPVPGEGLARTLRRIFDEPPMPIDRLEVPDDLREVVLRGLAKNPQERFATAEDFGKAFQSIQYGRSLGVTEMLIGAPSEDAAPSIHLASEGTPDQAEDLDLTVARAPQLFRVAESEVGEPVLSGDGHPFPSFGRDSDQVPVALVSIEEESASKQGGSGLEAHTVVRDSASSTVEPAGGASSEADVDGAGGTEEAGPSASEPTRRRFRRRARLWVAAGATTVLVAAGLVLLILGLQARSGYYAAASDSGEILVFKGQPGGGLWFSPTLAFDSHYQTSILSAATPAGKTIYRASSAAAVRAYLSSVDSDYEARVAAQQAARQAQQQAQAAQQQAAAAQQQAQAAEAAVNSPSANGMYQVLVNVSTAITNLQKQYAAACGTAPTCPNPTFYQYYLDLGTALQQNVNLISAIHPSPALASWYPQVKACVSGYLTNWQAATAYDSSAPTANEKAKLTATATAVANACATAEENIPEGVPGVNSGAFWNWFSSSPGYYTGS